MSAIQAFNEQKIADKMAEKASEKLAQSGLSGDALLTDRAIVFEFTKIAVSLVKGELATSLDERHAKQLIMIFVKCITQAIIKCNQHQVGGEMKLKALQALALDVYNLTKEFSLGAYQQAGQPGLEAQLEEGKKEIRKSAMQRLKFHIDQLKAG